MNQCIRISVALESTRKHIEGKNTKDWRYNLVIELIYKNGDSNADITKRL
jgi:hypothetical protein